MSQQQTAVKFFITHSWKDIDFARRLCDDLDAHGLSGFFDAYSIRPGDVISAEITRGLEACDIYLPILSHNALESPWCEEEINAAITLSKLPGRKERPRIIPILVEDCQDVMPIFLRSRLFINFAGRYDDALNELLTTGFGMSKSPLPRTPVSPPAPQPPVTAHPKAPEAAPTGKVASKGCARRVIPMALIVVLIAAACVVGWLLSRDTTEPTITKIEPLDGATLRAGSQVVINASYADDRAVDPRSIYLVLDGLDVAAQALISETSLTYAVHLDPGAHVVMLQLRDTSGNKASRAWQFTVAPFQAPVIDFSANQTVVSPGTPVLLSWKVTGADLVYLDQEKVDPIGTRLVTVNVTTVFQIIANNSNGTADKTLTLTVR